MEEKVKRTVIIEEYEGGGFNVRLGNKETEIITYDEMLGVVTSILIPEKRICLQWLKTREERQLWRDSIINKPLEFEQL